MHKTNISAEQWYSEADFKSVILNPGGLILTAVIAELQESMRHTCTPLSSYL